MGDRSFRNPESFTSPEDPFRIRDLRRVDRGKLLAAFVLDFNGATIECELFRRDDGTVWADARAVKDGTGTYRRTVVLNRSLRERAATQALVLYRGERGSTS